MISKETIYIVTCDHPDLGHCVDGVFHIYSRARESIYDSIEAEKLDANDFEESMDARRFGIEQFANEKAGIYYYIHRFEPSYNGWNPFVQGVKKDND